MTELLGYRHTAPFATRWNDNDVYGHLNNTVYYLAMDTVINAWLIGSAGLTIDAGESIAVCAASSCDFVASASYPDELLVGLRPGRIGRTSVTWELEIARADDAATLATGRFVHVWVERESRLPRPIPADVVAAIERDLALPAQ